MNNLVTLNNNAVSFECQKARLEAFARIDIVNCYLNFRKRYSLQKTAISDFLSMYNSRQLLPKIFKTIGTISGSTLQRWVRCFQKHGTIKAMLPKYKYSKLGEYNTASFVQLLRTSSIFNNATSNSFFAQ